MRRVVQFALLALSNSVFGAALPSELHSRPGAPFTIFLDFDGAPATQWGSYAAPATPAFTRDSEAVWARVSDKYSPFNVDVTTADPKVYTPGQVVRVVIGGNGGWVGAGGIGGATYTGSFYDDRNTAWVFPDNLGADSYVGEAAAHEAGHAFGLRHQSVYDASGNKLADYNYGNSEVAPIMGTSYYARRGVWQRGLNSFGQMQDDIALLTSVLGVAPDTDGVIETPTDVDTFTLSGWSSVSVTSDGMLDPVVRMDGRLVTASSLMTFAGTHILTVASDGTYGNIGSYQVSILPLVVAAVPEPAAGGLLLLVGGLLFGRPGRR